jgi:uncharacterized protein YbjT (DUF2867 family)|eukprot:COSAG06_NODE_1992_length_7894_cov_7.031174_8_plen_309_part_00
MLSDAETGAALEAMRVNAEGSELRLLLLGATGNVGRHCLERLLADAAESGEPVRLLVGTRDPEGFWSTYRHPRRCSAVVEPLACDVGDTASIAQAVAKAAPTRIFMALPQALAPEAMVSCGKACIDAAVAVGTSRLVRVSSLGIDQDDAPAGDDSGLRTGQGPLGDAHTAVEAHARQAGLPLVSVRPTSFHTNLLAYDAESIRTTDCFRSPLGVDARVNWVHCRDIGSVCAVALGRPDTSEAASAAYVSASAGAAATEIIAVTGPAASTLSAPEMAALLSEELGRKISYEEVAVSSSALTLLITSAHP